MKKRGKVLRDPIAGPGLLMVEGQQHSFSLEGVWKSEIAPKPGLVVDVEFDAAAKIAAITAVPDSQLAKEQAEAAMAVAKEKGAALASGLIANFGAPNLVAIGLLIVGWFFLATITVDAAMFGKLEFTFWQVLGYLNSSNVLQALGAGGKSPSTGLYGFLAIAAIASPFLSHVWKDKRAHLGGLLPLVFMVVVGFMVQNALDSAFGANTTAQGAIAQMQREAQAEAMKAISIGMGAYVSIVASLYLAGVGVKKFLAAKGSEANVYEKVRKAAA